MNDAQLLADLRAAEQERRAAIDAYNTVLTDHRKRGIFPVRVEQEHARMQAADKAFGRAVTAACAPAPKTVYKKAAPMKLWILRPVESLKPGDNPWEMLYDDVKAMGFVVRAEDEQSARQFAQEQACDEINNDYMVDGKVIRQQRSPWLDPAYSTCIPLTDDGEAGIVIHDICNA